MGLSPATSYRGIVYFVPDGFAPSDWLIYFEPLDAIEPELLTIHQGDRASAAAIASVLADARQAHWQEFAQ